MFHVFHNDILIGRSKLENGDPPMGCAEGQFAPFDEFTKFRKSVTPEQDNDVAIKRWAGLSLAKVDGTVIDCVDVVLFEFDFGDHKELYVDALGIDSALYEELFQGRYAEYEADMAPECLLQRWWTLGLIKLERSLLIGMVVHMFQKKLNIGLARSA